jgi:WD40 repeat protein
MAEQTTFETRLADAYERYVAPAPVEVDARALARSVVAGAAGHRWQGSDLVPTGRRLLLLAAALLVTALAAGAVGSRLLQPPPPAPFKGELVPSGSLTQPRTGAALAPLQDGRVLVIGGFGFSAEGTDTTDPRPTLVEAWDPADGDFSPVDGSFHASRAATTLLDGRVFILGTGRVYALFDPSTGEVSARSGMAVDRSGAAVTLLQDGRVLIVGGTADGTAELFDPRSNRFATTGSMTASRPAPIAVGLLDGRALIVGGGDSTAEVYDPVTGRFADLGSTGLWRDPPAATLLADGRVLLVSAARFKATAPAVVFDPTTDRFEPTFDVPSHVAAAAALADGSVLLVGDHETGGGTFAVLFDPAVGIVRELPRPTAYHPSVAALPDGGAILVGGYDMKNDGASLGIAELYR